MEKLNTTTSVAQITNTPQDAAAEKDTKANPDSYLLNLAKEGSVVSVR